MARFHQLRAWVVLAVAGLLLVLGGVSFARRVGATHPLTGVEWVQSPSGPLALRVGPAAAAAGLREGDLLDQIDGEDATRLVDAAELAWRAESRGPVTLRVMRGGTPLAVELVPGWRLRTEPYGYLAIVGLAFWLSALLVALLWPETRGGTVYALMGACLFAQLTLSRTGLADWLDWIIDWGDVVAGSLGPALLLHLGLALTRHPRRRTAVAAAYAVSATMALAAVWLSPAGLGGAEGFDNPLRAMEVWDRADHLLFSLAILLTTVVLAKSHGRSSSVMHRRQTRWLLWGLGLGLGPFVMLYAVPWGLSAAELAPWVQFLAVLPMLLVPAAFTAALARYRLHDLDLFLRRGLSEVAALFSTAAVLAATIFLLREVVDELIPVSRSATRYLGFLVAAVAYPQLRAWVKTGVDRAFYRQRYSYRATLQEWARELNAETDLSSLLGVLRLRIRETLGVSEAEVFLRTGPRRFEALHTPNAVEPLDLDDASCRRLEKESCTSQEEGALEVVPWARYLFPVKVKGQLRAVLAVAERDRRDEPLTSEDRALLVTLSAHAGTAIEAARLLLEVRRRVEEIERLHAQQARIFEASAVGLLLVDGEDRILAWNRALEEIYALPREQAVGRRLAEVFPFHVAHRIGLEGDRRTQEEARIFRLTLINRQSRRVVLNIAISDMAAGSDQQDGPRVVTFDDVTERVQLEEQVLQQERLASLGLLAAGVAHEINTPLTGISGYTQMLLEEAAGGDPSVEVLKKIDAQARRASQIANSLLTLARPERSVFEALDLNEAIREVLQLFEPQIRGRDIQFRAELDNGLPTVRGHRGKLQQVLLNLLLNARDAVGDGGTIQVTTYHRQDRILVEVTDDGVGISPQDLPRIFDPFFTTKGRGKGTGLGLSVSYGIVEEHAGRIEAESLAGVETRFRVELPSARTARATAS